MVFEQEIKVDEHGVETECMVASNQSVQGLAMGAVQVVQYRETIVDACLVLLQAEIALGTVGECSQVFIILLSLLLLLLLLLLL
mgnify:FL=1